MHTRRIDIELRIRDVLRVLRSTSKIEDAGVELKGTPPSPETKAGQLAGAANASGGDPIVWVFGIADDGSFVDIAGFDFDQWFAKIPSQFDGPYPEPTIAWLEEEGHGLLAVSFRTDHAPYVVKRSSNPQQRDMPWREGSHTRSATRSELIRMLLPQARLPRIEFLGGAIAFETKPGQHPDQHGEFSFSAELFIEHADAGGIHLSQHRCAATIRIGEQVFTAPAGHVSLQSMEREPHLQPSSIRPTSAGLYMQSAGSFAFHTKRIELPSVFILHDLKEAQITVALGFGPPVGLVEGTVTTAAFANNRMSISPGTQLLLHRR